MMRKKKTKIPKEKGRDESGELGGGG